MKQSALSIQVVTEILNQSNEPAGFKKLIQSILHKSKNELEFIARVREEIRNIFQDMSPYYEELKINTSDYALFKTILKTIQNKLNKFDPPKIRGKLNTEKGGVEYSFIYEYHYDYLKYILAPGYVFHIWDSEKGAGKENGGYFSFQLREMENGKDLKVTDLYADVYHYYNGKGISVGIILEAKKLFNKRIISSSNKNAQTGYKEFNTESAIEKVWEPLLSKGLVKYNTELDYYYTV